MIYHASTWPLMLAPAPHELLDYLDHDYGLTELSTDEQLAAALAAAGHGEDGEAYSGCIRSCHAARRYQAQNGEPF